MRRTDPLVAAALEAQERERATGFATANPSLTVLSELEPDDLLLLVQELRSGSVAERELSARLLIDSALPGERTVDVVRDLLECESDPDVIRWLVTALQYSRARAAISDLEALSRHPDARVRFGVPDALSSCAQQLGDVAETLLRLSRDSDRDVRWSATFEIAAWLNEPSSVIASKRELDDLAARLRELGSSDPDREIRSAAAQGLRHWRPGSQA